MGPVRSMRLGAFPAISHLRRIPNRVAYRALKTVDRYVLREWLKIFGLSIAITLGLLVLNDMYSNFSDLMDYQAGVGQILAYYAVLVPSFLPLILPISLLLSLLFTLGNFHRNNELVALRASGFSIGRITVTLWISGAVLSGALLLLNARVVPWSVEQSRRMLENIEFAYLAQTAGGDEVGMIHTLTFDNHRDNRMWFINRFSAFTYRGFGVNVYKLDEQRREVSRIMAREVHYDDYRREWIFHDGRRMVFDPETGETLRAPAFDQLTDDDLTETPETIILFTKRPRDLSLHEIRRVLEAMGMDNPRASSFEIRYHSILAGAFSCLIIVGLAIPFSTTGVRVNPMVGISKSLSLFLLYYVLDNVGRILGERDLIAPIAAAWLPGLAMALLAAWFFRRAR
jgi:lipopolysaccharide export system permease protein